MSSAHSASIPMHEWKWSAAEKAIAHSAFDLALNREKEAVIQQAKQRAARIVEASELWELEHWLTKRRQNIDRKFDFRYSVLPSSSRPCSVTAVSPKTIFAASNRTIDAIRHIANR